MKGSWEDGRGSEFGYLIYKSYGHYMKQLASKNAYLSRVVFNDQVLRHHWELCLHRANCPVNSSVEETLQPVCPCGVTLSCDVLSMSSVCVCRHGMGLSCNVLVWETLIIITQQQTQFSPLFCGIHSVSLALPIPWGSLCVIYIFELLYVAYLVWIKIIIDYIYFYYVVICKHYQTTL